MSRGFPAGSSRRRSGSSKTVIQESLSSLRGRDNMREGFQIRDKEAFPPFRGDIRITLRDKQGREEVVSMPNIVVQTASVLIARLMKNNLEPGLHGAQYLALGTGNPAWDPMAPPPATVEQTRLENEIIRKAFTEVDFIDSEGNVSVAPTNIIDLVAIFGEGEAVAPLVEMGVVGGEATMTPFSGTLINYRTFRVINKPATATMTIVWRFTF